MTGLTAGQPGGPAGNAAGSKAPGPRPLPQAGADPAPGLVIAGFPARQIESSQAMPRNRAEDQVVRRNEFSHAHPEVSFEFRRETGKWEAMCPTGGNGVQIVYGSELREVLDKLEERFE